MTFDYDMVLNCAILYRPSLSHQVILSIIVSATQENGIGRNGTLPWKLPSDMKYLQKITTCFNPANTQAENILVMGRCSIPSKFRPLSARRNCVLSRDLEISSYQLQMYQYSNPYHPFYHHSHQKTWRCLDWLIR